MKILFLLLIGCGSVKITPVEPKETPWCFEAVLPGGEHGAGCFERRETCERVSSDFRNVAGAFNVSAVDVCVYRL